MAEVLIKAQGVSKKFCKDLKRSMVYSIKDIFSAMFSILPNNDNLRTKEFWALDNISFELGRGECLGLIGPNGSGKSTLLKILNGIIAPDKGRMEIKGRVGALIEIGAGFHPLLTGRENIYVNGSILGFSKKEIDKKFDDIIEFAELEEFIDTPVKHYSSGMYVRLGFAIAAQMEPDVVLIDEVLAVGDVGFRAKCFNAISRISKNAAVIFVSHAMPQVSRVCSDILVMNDGRTTYAGKDVPKGIEHYYSHFATQKGIVTGSGRATIYKLELESKGKNDVERINYLDDLTIHLRITVASEVKNPVLNVSFLSLELQIVAQCNSSFNGILIRNTGEPSDVTIKIPAMNFNPGVYVISVTILDEGRSENLIQYYAIKQFYVQGKFVGLAPVQLIGEWSLKQKGSSV